MVERICTNVILITLGSFSLSSHAMDWLDIQPGQTYTIGHNTAATLICDGENGQGMGNAAVTVGPQPGADIPIRTVEVLSKRSPSGLRQPTYVISVRSTELDIHGASCRLDLSQIPGFFGGLGTEFSSIL